MIYLLDANILIAMVDPVHVHHEIAQTWFENSVDEGWATCPITENALLRIGGQASYPLPGTPTDMANILLTIRAMPNHVFWPDAFSMVDCPLIDHARLSNSGQVTDIYLLALAVHNGGALATLDRKLKPDAVRGGSAALHLIRPSP